MLGQMSGTIFIFCQCYQWVIINNLPDRQVGADIASILQSAGKCDTWQTLNITQLASLLVWHETIHQRIDFIYNGKHSFHDLTKSWRGQICLCPFVTECNVKIQIEISAWLASKKSYKLLQNSYIFSCIPSWLDEFHLDYKQCQHVRVSYILTVSAM